MKNNAVTPPAAPDRDTELIWDTFSVRLLDFIKKHVGEVEAARDILQDVFEKIHLKKDTVKDNTKLVSWLFQLTRNSIVDHYRNKRNNREELRETISEKRDDVAMFEELECCINPFLNQLSPEERDLIKRIDQEGNSQKELAAALGIPYASLKSKVQRARVKLKALFVQCCALELSSSGGIVEMSGDRGCKNC